jgi:hypothetical protein
MPLAHPFGVKDNGRVGPPPMLCSGANGCDDHNYTVGVAQLVARRCRRTTLEDGQGGRSQSCAWRGGTVLVP